MNESHFTALASYVDALTKSAERTERAEDRSIYLRHLAETAQLVPALAADDPAGLGRWVKSAARTYGVGYLSGPAGERAGEAFARLRDELGYRRA